MTNLRLRRIYPLEEQRPLNCLCPPSSLLSEVYTNLVPQQWKTDTLGTEVYSSLCPFRAPAAENNAQTGSVCLWPAGKLNKHTKCLIPGREQKAPPPHHDHSLVFPPTHPPLGQPPLSGSLTALCYCSCFPSSLCSPSLSLVIVIHQLCLPTHTKAQFERSIWMKWLDYNRETIG